MDDSLLPIVYLSILVTLLAVASWFIFRQIWRTRRTETTLTRLQDKLNQGKGTAKEHYELGGILLDKRLYSQAIAQFQKALKAKDIKDKDAKDRDTKNKDARDKDAQDADSSAENQALIYNALGFAYAAQEQFDLAIRQYKEALQLLPNYPTALNNLGFAYEKKQLIAQALEAYEEALQIDPKNSTAKRRAESLRKRLVPSS